MAKSSGKGMKFLGVLGGVALLLVAWRFPVPLPFIAEPMTLLSAVAVLLGILAGWREAAIITTIYVLAVILGVPPALWGGHSGDVFFASHFSGLNLGLIAAAIVAGKIAPGAQSGYLKLTIAVLAGQLAYLACGFAWLLRFGPVAYALHTGVYPFLIPCLVKAAVAFLAAAVAAKFVK